MPVVIRASTVIEAENLFNSASADSRERYERGLEVLSWYLSRAHQQGKLAVRRQWILKAIEFAETLGVIPSWDVESLDCYQEASNVLDWEVKL